MQRRLNPFLFVVLTLVSCASNRQSPIIEGRAIWAYPGDAGRTREEIIQFVEQIDRANINLIVMLVKGSGGDIYWQSKRFAECMNDFWKERDGLKILIDEAHRRKLRVHAWLCDFIESATGPAFQAHPEWAMRNADGETTAGERIQEGRPYNRVWMCPARRPGYTDQWLLPMIRELTESYDLDGIHHDYVRYPGDVSPDGYCFCDHCLDGILEYSHLYYVSFPDSQFTPEPVLPRLEANWWMDYAGKPEGWNSFTREQKTRFLLNGESWRFSRADMDYYTYSYRTDAINRFVREAWETAREVDPDIQISAAVFKNPIASGRSIGQRWTAFAPWVDIMMPMCYRSHFPGDFETFLALLSEYVRYETIWSRGLCHNYIGVTAHYIYKEEYEPVQVMSRALQRMIEGIGNTEENWKLAVEAFESISENLLRIDGEREKRLTEWLESIDANRISNIAISDIRELKASVDTLLNNPPAGFYPGEKLKQTIQTIRDAGGEGIVLFAAPHLSRKQLWKEVEEIYSQPSLDPDIVQPLQGVSIQSVR